MSKKSILLPSPSLLRFRKRGETEAWFPMTLLEFGPSNTKGYDWTFRDKRMLWNDVSTATLIEKFSKYKPGDEVACTEVYQAYYCADGRQAAEKIGYRADRWVEHEGCTYAIIYKDSGSKLWHSRWAAASKMPLWAVRTRATVVSVEPRRPGTITEEEAKACGVEPLSYYANCLIGMDDRIHGFRHVWNKSNPRHPYSPDAWAWRISLKGAER